MINSREAFQAFFLDIVKWNHRHCCFSLYGRYKCSVQACKGYSWGWASPVPLNGAAVLYASAQSNRMPFEAQINLSMSWGWWQQRCDLRERLWLPTVQQRGSVETNISTRHFSASNELVPTNMPALPLHEYFIATLCCLRLYLSQAESTGQFSKIPFHPLYHQTRSSPFKKQLYVALRVNSGVKLPCFLSVRQSGSRWWEKY